MYKFLPTIIVLLCWPVYLLLFLGRGQRSSQREKKDLSSALGILSQGAGVFIVFSVRRPLFSPLIEPAWPLDLVALLMAIAAVCVSRRALRVLGEHWSLVARVTGQHKLIQHGPFAVVRHPLYSCFFALTLATGIVWTEPLAIPLAMGIFSIGVWIRIRTEEKLLREAFGAEFDDYAKRVPAVIPGF